jgi:ferritin-like metal-binding protein YciE
MKSFLAHFFGLAPKMAQAGHETEEKTTQDLMMAFAVENSEVAMFESLITVCEAAGDHQTANIAREIQQQEQATADKLWPHISRTARVAFDRVAAENVG